MEILRLNLIVCNPGSEVMDEKPVINKIIECIDIWY